MLLAPLAQAAPPAGCTVAGEAYGAQVTAAGVLNLAKVADVVLPGAPVTVASVSVPGTLTSNTVTDSSTDASTPTQASATSTSNVQAVAFLGATITADAVTSVATSTSNGTTASSSPSGTAFVNLKINGVAQANVAANTTVNLPGVGSVVINEQLPSGNGTTSSGLTVNALHVHVTTLGILPAGSDIIIASATSNASCAGPLATTAPTPTNTSVATTTSTPTNTPTPTTPMGTSWSGHATAANATIPPAAAVVVGDTGPLPAAGGTIAPPQFASLTVPNTLTLNAVTVSTTGGGTRAASSVNIASTGVTLPGLTVSAGAITSQTAATCGASGVQLAANSTIASLAINGATVTVVGAANQAISVPGIATIVLNEQTTTNGNRIVVNALHIRLLNGAADVVVGQADSDIACTTPSGGGSGGGGGGGPSGTATPVLTSAEATAAARGGANATATPNGGTGGANATATPGAVSTNASAVAGGGTGSNPTAVPSTGGGNATATAAASGGNPTATPGGGAAGAGPAASPNLVLNISPPPPFTPGGTGSIAITVANQGPADAPGPITVIDTLPPGFTYQEATGDGSSCSASGQTVTCSHAGPLAAGASLGLSLQVAVDASAAPVSTDRATVSGASGTPVADAEAPLVVQGASGAPDLAINGEPPGPFAAGGTGSLRITVTNVGTADDPGPEIVTDVLPAGFTFLGSTGGGWVCSASGQTVTCTRDGSLAVNESSQFSLQVAVDTSAATGMNSVTVSPPPGGLGGRMEFPLVVVGAQTSTGGIPSTGGVGGGAAVGPAASTDSSGNALGDETARAGQPAAQVPRSPSRLPNTGSAGVDSDRPTGAAGLFAAGLLALGLLLRSRARRTWRRRERGPIG